MIQTSIDTTVQIRTKAHAEGEEPERSDRIVFLGRVMLAATDLCATLSETLQNAERTEE